MTRDHLLVPLAIIMVVAVAAGVVGTLYLGPRQAALAEADDRRAQLADLVARVGRLRSELAADAGPTSMAPGAVAIGQPPAEAAAQLQEQARRQVVQWGGAALSSQTVTSDLGGGYTKISVLLRARFDEIGMLAFLRDMEQRQPLITVEALTVRPLPVGAGVQPLDVSATLAEFHTDAPS